MLPGCVRVKVSFVWGGSDELENETGFGRARVVAALAITLSAAPAQARFFVGFGFGYPGFYRPYYRPYPVFYRPYLPPPPVYFMAFRRCSSCFRRKFIPLGQSAACRGPLPACTSRIGRVFPGAIG